MDVFKAILDGITVLKESCLSKAGEKTADYVANAAYNFVDQDSNVKRLGNNLNFLNQKASDMEEEIMHAELSGKKKRKREVEEWLTQAKTIRAEWAAFTDQPEGLKKRFLVGGKAAELNEKVEKFIQLSLNFRKELLLDVRGAGRVTLLTTKMVGEAFQENLGKVCRLLETREVPSIALYGMGGVGKTTLAKQIHNQLVKQSTRDVFWVTVSQGINIKSLQDKIASSLGFPKLFDGVDEVETRASNLHGVLSKMNNPVLILDDVWENIKLLEVGCVVSKEGCMLIITTRSEIVYRGIDCKEIVAMETLNEEEAWKLFSETLGEETKLDHKVEEVAKSVAKLCDGLPLGIITVAGSMRGETNDYAWRHASDELKKCEVGGDDWVFNVLKYSFDRLTERSEFNLFQRCFLYCSLYPEDYEIPKEELVGKLISEGLIEGGKSRREEVDHGLVIVDHLVKVCLLESCVGLDGSKCVKMHDLIRAMALKITKGKYMVKAGDKSIQEIPMEQEWAENLEKVSLMDSYIWIIENCPNCPILSTLLLQHNILLQCIDDSFFCRMQGLRTLDLSHTIIDRLPKSIFELESLEAMLLNDCQSLEHVPSLRKLKALRELHLDSTSIKEVPEGLEKLLNLKVLSLALTEVDVLPTGLLLNLVGLQILRLPSHVQVPIEELQNLNQVEVFTGALKSVDEFNSFITSRVHDHTTYKIKVGRQDDFKNELEIEFGYCDKAVILTGCRLENVDVLGMDIECLVMRICEGLSRCLMDDLSRWNNFKSLKVLGIHSCGGIEFILRSEHDEVATSLFSTLEEIDLEDLEDLEGLFETRGASTAPALVTFSSLACLQARSCMKMKRLGLPLSGFPKLISLHLLECGDIEEIFKDELGRRGGEIGEASVALPQPEPLIPSLLTRLDIRRCNKVRKLGVSVLEVPNLQEIEITDCSEIEEIFEAHQGTSSGVALPKLQKLTLKSLPRLKSVHNAPIICNSIQQINILKCPVLTKKLPLHFDDHPPQSLKEIAVEREWWGSLEWDNTNLPALLQSFLKFKD